MREGLRSESRLSPVQAEHVRKILASSPFSQALIDKQMNTVFDDDGRDETSPTRIKPTHDPSPRPVNTLFGNSPCNSVLPTNLEDLP